MAENGLEFSTPIQFLKGVGPSRGSALENAGIATIKDLLYYFPRRHLDRTGITQIKDLRESTWATVVADVMVCGERRTRRGKMFEATVSDNSQLLKLVWFNGVEYVAKSLKVGDRLAVHGKVESYQGKQMVHPEYDRLAEGDDPLHSGSVVPIYPSTGELKQVGLDGRGFRRIVRNMLESLPDVQDHFSDTLLSQENLIPLNDAIRQIHFADQPELLKQSIKRLKFDEHFFLQLLMALKKDSIQRSGTKALEDESVRANQIIENLHFELTKAQNRVYGEISEDMKHPTPMNRLLQGDVGSGKTIIAVLSAVRALDNGMQAAVMAPTEILAQQHFRTFKKFLKDYDISIALLTGKMKSAERRSILEKTRSGDIDILIGTHAVIQKDVKFENLGFIVVDEQHRFGVNQRGSLVEKGWNPHLLAMTATPIPRTLAITYLGDMDLSIIDEMPKHRIPVVTKSVLPDRLEKVYAFVRDEVQKGRQCMVVFPLVEESEKSDLAAAVEEHARLSKDVFSSLQVGLIHGRMKQDKKDEIMANFENGDIDVLVSTTVIEVGIDVPKATIMIVEHADRFGLTQLHQLRGRVGRGTEKSYCILVERKATERGKYRLEVMERTNDGFEISDEDLKMRGPGEFFGEKQSGFIRYRIADLMTDGNIVKKARKAAFALVEKDPGLTDKDHSFIKQRFDQEYAAYRDSAGIS
ncbi:MAG: ATP-dependent DNA helicase RecG [Candidatus Marinimicrobia bacterium]|nr:ATP-dependent DNA helicase RecG [Candidatus Neomarinimicrobiota bacterium]MDP7072815.1 ATP-dependent DNA helicase RecG [Candidatus Neomarinimicrobiota bacterium]